MLSKPRKRNIHSSRKDTRKAAREQKKAPRHGPPPNKRQKTEHRFNESKRLPISRTLDPQPASQPKSILKKPKASRHAVPTTEEQKEREAKKITKTVQQKLDEDDEEIAALESKLGLKKRKKLPKAFEEDGLTELLEGLDDDLFENEVSKRRDRTEGDEWLEGKRKAAHKAALRKGSHVPRSEDANKQSDGNLEDDPDSEMLLDDSEPMESGSEHYSDNSNDEMNPSGSDGRVEDDFDGFQSEDEDVRPKPRVRENPYVAPVPKGQAPLGKYIPPSLRKPSDSDTEAFLRLRRQTQGLVNRLTEANMLSILSDVEKLYRENARQHVTDVLVDILLTAICEPTSLPETLIILHAGFIAALYKVIGTDFGAQVVQRIVELFDQLYAQLQTSSNASAPSPDASKETSNLIALLCAIYNFQVVGSNIIFDYIKMLLGALTEFNAELLLRIIRASGPQLRQDSPSSLKDIVTMLRPAVASIGEENLSVRTKFMIEAINDVKNNRVKTGVAASAVNSEHIIRMKKTLGSLNSRNIKGSEPLRIGLQDIKDSDKKGKWWLVGASWSGNTNADADELTSKNLKTPVKDRKQQTSDVDTSDLFQLAREQRMNTDIRRSIFISLISATDYQDAYLRMMRLKLKKAQELEVPKVVLHCAGAEQGYNPYYTLIAKKLCGDRRIKMAFQFCLWDLFRRMGESNDDDDDPGDDDEDLDTRHIVNLAKMFGSLVAEAALGLSILKHLNLSSLQPKTMIFVEVMFITLFIQSQRQADGDRDEKAIINIISRAKENPQLIVGLQYFLKKAIRKTEIAGSKVDRGTVRWACKVALTTLDTLGAVDTLQE